mmetsp:Transcript_23839/g.67519  ORF Transcript_23839/g.67519 Transcript_23839/m.67519 type:complete len:374 (+) Transcript_23839:342-1463(+)
MGLQGLADGLRVFHHLVLVDLELRGLRHLQCNCQCRDGLIVGAALQTRENRGVDFLLKVPHDGSALLVGTLLPLAEEDHGAAGPAQGLVRGRGDDVRVVEGRGDVAAHHEARDVRHVRQQDGTAIVRDLAHALVVDQAGVRARAGDEDLRADAGGELLALVVVDEAGALVQAVGDGLEVLRDHADFLGLRLEAVRQVAAVGQVQAHDAIMHVAECGVDLEVRRRAAEGLDVDAPLLGVQPARLQSSLHAERLRLIDELVPSVIPRSGVALGVLVHHHGADGLEHRLRGEVLRGDEAQATALAVLLFLDDAKDLGVHIHQGDVQLHGLRRDAPLHRRRGGPRHGASREAGADALHGSDQQVSLETGMRRLCRLS